MKSVIRKVLNPFVLALTIALPSIAQTYSVLHSFEFGGRNPFAPLVQGPDGMLYGTTRDGGTHDTGTIFKIKPDGSGYTLLYSFLQTGIGLDAGVYPETGLTLSGNTLYGTTRGDDASTYGTIFKINTDGSGYTNVFSFGGSPGTSPVATLLQAGDTLYGTTESGGSGDSGTVFKITTNGTGFTLLKDFPPRPAPDYTNSDGARPQGELALSGNVLYGTADAGGSFGNGTIFRVNTDGTGFAVLKTFSATLGTNYTNTDGAGPEAGLIMSGGALYGATVYGGNAGLGTVFRINTDGNGFTNLLNFSDTNHDSLFGLYPTTLASSGGALYAMTYYGGSSNKGTLFKINTDGSGSTNLHSFGGSGEGVNPRARLLVSGSQLYGTTSHGGGFDNGTVFRINTDGSGLTNLHNFIGAAPGAYPGFLVVSGGTLYGTTQVGGNPGQGTIFKVNTDGSGFAFLKTFPPLDPIYETNSDGATVSALLLSGGTLYGAAADGGNLGHGTIFRINTDGNGFSNLHDFNISMGAKPVALTLAGSTLYGTTLDGGPVDHGILFKINTNGSGFGVLPVFGANLGDGAFPSGQLAIAADGTQYGTTSRGGTADWGILYKVKTNGTGYSVVYNFTNGTDGASPVGGVVLSNDTLFGSSSINGPAGWGVIFRMNTNGSGFTNLHNFTHGNDGYSGLVSFLSGSALYGTAQGGATGQGTIFKVNIDGTGFTNIYNFSGANDGFGPGSVTEFGGRLYGTAGGGALGGGVVFGLVPFPLPALRISRSGSMNVISWPSPSTGFVLQQNSNLAPANWSGSGFTISDDGTNKSISVASQTGSLFFRLIYP